MNEPRLTKRVHDILQDRLKAGDIAIDATIGNGHDTAFLAEKVGINGKVYGFDIQYDAIASTHAKLQQSQLSSIVTLHQKGHEEMINIIPFNEHKKIKAITFNLGYLPGSDKTCTTQTTTTLKALNDSLHLLAPKGILTVLAYPGHESGNEETKSVLAWTESLQDKYQVQYFKNEITNKPSPILITISNK